MQTGSISTLSPSTTGMTTVINNISALPYVAESCPIHKRAISRKSAPTKIEVANNDNSERNIET